MLNISDITSAADAQSGFGLGACPAHATSPAPVGAARSRADAISGRFAAASSGSTIAPCGGGNAMSSGSGAVAQWAGNAANKGRPATYAGVANVQPYPTKQHNALVTRTAVIGGTLGSHPAREPV